FQWYTLAAAFAWSSVGKFSTRQYSGPFGSCLTFISATGLTTYCTSSAHDDGGSSKATMEMTGTRRAAEQGSFISSSHSRRAIQLPFSCQTMARCVLQGPSILP